MNLIGNKHLFKCENTNDMNWHSFVKWWSINRDKDFPSQDYLEIKKELYKYTISEYPNGNLMVIHKDDGDMISGVWFYINGHKIRLIPYSRKY